MLSLKGKGVCGGVTLGTLAVLRRNAAAVKRRKVQNAEAEVARFQTARQDAIDKLAELYEKAVADVGKDNAAIFEIHQMMLEDLDYIESVEGIIRTQQVNAEYAVQTIAANFAEIFSSMEDDYMRQFQVKTNWSGDCQGLQDKHVSKAIQIIESYNKKGMIDDVP